MNIADQDRPFSVRRYLVIGALAIAFLVAAVGGWSGLVQISGAVIAQGAVVAASDNKKVQHPTGGVVGEIMVREGTRVEANQILMRLDETVARAGHSIVTRSLNELTARQARLRAERDTVDAIAFPEALLAERDDANVAHILESETRLFALRREARIGLSERLQERILQLQKEAGGYEAQIRAKQEERVLIERELEGVRQLFEKNLIPIARLTALEREATRIAGEAALLEAKVAETRGRAAETEVQILQIGRDTSSEAARELREVEGRIGELTERRFAAEDQMRRIDIRAPQNGVVHQMMVHTIGGVIAPGQDIMTIVPDNDDLVVEIQISPSDIDQVSLGAETVLRFSAFQQRSSPEKFGTVGRISADVSVEERSGLRYYIARIDLDPRDFSQEAGTSLMSGMPVEAFIKTADRTPFSFLTKPLTDQINRTFRHD